MQQQLKARVLSDIEGPVLIKRKQFARKVSQYVRIHGGVLSVHTNEKSCVKWDVDILGSTVTSLRARSFTLNLKSGPSLYITLQGQDAKPAQWFNIIKKVSERTFEADYTLGEKIGEGAFASVHTATDNKTGTPVAVKTVVKRQFDTTMARELDREVLTCASLRVPGIIATHEIFHTQQKVHLVMDLMLGGTLKDRVQSVGGRVPENVAAPILHDTLLTLANLHRLGVAHRDVKLENILCDTPTLPTKRTVLCDFGYVNFLEPGEETMRSLVGTPVYVAPEIAERKSYGVGVDTWATGVMAYRMLSGEYPFDGGADDEKTMACIMRGDLLFPKERWEGISPECISLIRGLLHQRPKTRLSAEGALHHEWFEKFPPSSNGHHRLVGQGSVSNGIEHNAVPQGEVKNNPAQMDVVRAASTRQYNQSSGFSAGRPDKDRQSSPNPSRVEASKIQMVQAVGNRLAHQLSASSRTLNPSSKAALEAARMKTRNRFRVAVAMIIFGVRLGVDARLRTPPGSPHRAKTDPIPELIEIPLSAHPVQLVPLEENTMVVKPADYSSDVADSSNPSSPTGSEVTADSTQPPTGTDPSRKLKVPPLNTDRKRGEKTNGMRRSQSFLDDKRKELPRHRNAGMKRFLSISLSTPRTASGRSPRGLSGFGRRKKRSTQQAEEEEPDLPFETEVI